MEQLLQIINGLSKYQNFKIKLKQVCKSNHLPFSILNGLTINKIKSIYQRTLQHYQKTPEKARISWFQNQLRLFYWILIFQSLLTFCLIKQFVIKIISKKLEQWATIASIFKAKAQDMLEFEVVKLLGESKQQNFRTWNTQQSELLLKILQDRTLISRWAEVAKHFYELSGKRYYRSSKQCREQWFNHLDNSKKHGQWQEGEDLIILKYILQNGQKWSQICKLYLPHRTQHMIKNRYKSMLLKYKLKKNDNHREVKCIKRHLRFIENKGRTQKEMNIKQAEDEEPQQRIQIQQKYEIKQVNTFGTQQFQNQDESGQNSSSLMKQESGYVSVSLDELQGKREQQQLVQDNHIQQNSWRNIQSQPQIPSYNRIINSVNQFSVNPSLGFNTFYFYSVASIPYGQSTYPFYSIPTTAYSSILQFPQTPASQPPNSPQAQNPSP